MMNRILIFLGIFMLALISGCGQTPFRGLQTPVRFSALEKISCGRDSGESYYVYLPTFYKQETAMPVILLFDSHGDGKLAVEKFREAAEIYGYILAGSNNSKNGIDASGIASNLLEDVKKRYAIDKKRIYAAGFSGGGRVAQMIALQSTDIAGIITCSAGLGNLSAQPGTHPFDVYGIAGLEDFNYREVEAIPQTLQPLGWNFGIDLFNGGHAWPPAEQIGKAVLWLELTAMKKEILSKNKPLIQAAADSAYKAIFKTVAVKNLLEADHYCQWCINAFQGLISTDRFTLESAKIEAMAEYQSMAANANQLLAQEEKLSQAYMQNFVAKDTLWWKNEIQTLNQEMEQSQDILYQQMLARTKGLLGIMSYSYSSRMLEQNDLTTTARVLAIYKMLEPKNPDMLFFQAVYLDKKGKTAASLASLKEALDHGFSETARINSSFSPKMLELLKK